jgi:aldehyde dehydrogenase (NAD+)
MAAWKIAPALASGNTVVLKPAETTPLTALVLAEIIAGCELPPAWSTSSPVRRHGAALRGAPGRRQDRVHRLDGGRQAIQRTIAGTASRLTLELGGKAANIVFDDAPLDQAVEGIVNGIFFNQGPRVLRGSRLLVQESVADDCSRAPTPDGHAARRRSAGQEHRHRRHQLGEQLARDREMADAGDARAPSGGQPACELPDRGFWFRRRCSRRHQATGSHARRSSARCSRSSRSARRTRRWRRPTTRRTACPPASGPRRARDLWMTGSSGRRRLGEHVQQFDPTSPFGGYKESGFGREGGRHGLAPYLSTRAGG